MRAAGKAFVISLFNDHVGMYAVRNDGGWYAGFMIGVSTVFTAAARGGGAAAGHAEHGARRPRRQLVGLSGMRDRHEQGPRQH